MDTNSTPPPLSRGRSLRWLAFVICPVVGLVGGLLVSLLLLYVGPKAYESVAVIQVNEVGISSEVRPIVTRELAESVVAELDLAMLWNVSGAEARSRLEKNVSVELRRGTDLIELRVRAASRHDSRDIAAALAGGLLRIREGEEAKRSKVMLEAIADELGTQEAEVELLRLAYAKASGPLHAGIAAQEHAKFRLENEKRQAGITRKALDRLKGDELRRYAARSATGNNGVDQLYNELIRERRGLAALRDSGLGSAHPSMIRAGKQVLKLETDLDGAILALRVELGKQEELLGGQIEELGESGSGIPREEVQALAEEYEQARDLLSAMKLKASEERILAKLPRRPVTIHQLPDLARKPVSPRAPVHLALGSGIGLLIGLLAAFPIALIGRK